MTSPDMAEAVAYLASLGRKPVQCGRPTRQQTACKAWVMIGAPACGSHATAEEHERSRQAQEAARMAYRLSDVPGDPACWSWPVTDADCAAAAAVEEIRAGSMLADWQQDRCAICGTARLRLVKDHDHATGLVRGWLCESCNLHEGHGHGGKYARYRERNPATMLGLRARYYSSYSGWAEPAEPPTPLDRSPVYLIAHLFAHDDEQSQV